MSLHSSRLARSRLCRYLHTSRPLLAQDSSAGSSKSTDELPSSTGNGRTRQWDKISISTSGQSNIDRLSESGLDELREHSTSQQEMRRQGQRSMNRGKNTAEPVMEGAEASFQPTDIGSQPQSAFGSVDIPPQISADPFANPETKSEQPRRSLLDRVDSSVFFQSESESEQSKGPKEVNDLDETLTRKPQRPEQRKLDAPPFSRVPPRPSGPRPGFQNAVRMRGRPMRGMAARGARGGMGARGGTGGRGAARGGRGGRGGRAGMRTIFGEEDESGQGLTETAAWLSTLPPPVTSIADQSLRGLFGGASILTPAVRGAKQPQSATWAQDLTPAEARKAEVLRLAGSYETLLPSDQRPSEIDPKKAFERAKAGFMWNNTLHRGAGHSQALLAAQKKLEQALS